MMPSSWQWQGAGQAGRPGPGWGSLPAITEAHSTAQSHGVRSLSGLCISAAGCGGTWRALGQAGAQSSERAAHLLVPGGPEGCAVGGTALALLGLGAAAAAAAGRCSQRGAGIVE